MAQTAMSIQAEMVTGLTMGLSTAEVEKIVKAMLKGYKKLHIRINAAKARGNKGLTGYQKQLALVGKAYAKGAGNMHKEKAERFFEEKIHDACDKNYFNDARALRELSGLMVGTTPFNAREEGVTDWNGKVVTEEREFELVLDEHERVYDEAAQIDDALQVLEEYDARFALILRKQYIEGWKVQKVIAHMIEEDKELGGSLADSTYHTWRKEALRLFGMAVGLC